MPDAENDGPARRPLQVGPMQRERFTVAADALRDLLDGGGLFADHEWDTLRAAAAICEEYRVIPTRPIPPAESGGASDA